LAESALRKKRWSDASAAYRDLIRVWPDNAEARESLLDSLQHEGRILARHNDHAKTLAVADEILTVQPDDFRALMLRAEALYDLERWKESKEAFAKAKRIKPSNKAANKGFWKAQSKLRKSPG
ncbi:MAG: tetratricopeptide repeat protein, partial [Myxococcales bacterium]|nr:tetratricopeptide repeat protein [Myxococcales bacterium]